MGALVRIVVFAVGLIGLALTGANGAEEVGFDVASHLAKLGAFGGAATAAVDLFGGGLAQIGHLIGSLQGPAKEGATEPSLLVKWAPEAIAALASGMMMMGSARR